MVLTVRSLESRIGTIRSSVVVKRGLCGHVHGNTQYDTEFLTSLRYEVLEDSN